jgi:hypothetical protein
MTTRNPKLWFVLGRESQLSVAEIISIIGPHDYSVDSGILKTASSLDAKILMPHLGGTIKIAEEISTNLTEEELLHTMVEELKKTDGKIIFGMSMYSSVVGVENFQPLPPTNTCSCRKLFCRQFFLILQPLCGAVPLQ